MYDYVRYFLYFSFTSIYIERIPKIIFAVILKSSGVQLYVRYRLQYFAFLNMSVWKYFKYDDGIYWVIFWELQTLKDLLYYFWNYETFQYNIRSRTIYCNQMIWHFTELKNFPFHSFLGIFFEMEDFGFVQLFFASELLT